MTYEYDDDDLLGNEVEWAKSTGAKRVCWNLPQGRRIRVRFCSDPATRKADKGWVFFREVNAFNGLIGGADLPGGLKEFPVRDFVIVKDPDTGRKLKQRVSDDLLAKVRPSKWDIERAEKDNRAPYPSASDKILTSVVYLEGDLEKKSQYNPASGEQIFLKMSKSRYQDLEAAFEMYHDVVDGFTLLGTVWDLMIEGQGTGARLLCKLVKDYPPTDDLPSARNGQEYIDDVRNQVNMFVSSLDREDVTMVETMNNPMGEDPAWDNVEPFEADVAVEGIDWTSIAPAAIRAKLKAINVPVPARIRNDALIELAREHLSAVDMVGA